MDFANYANACVVNASVCVDDMLKQLLKIVV